MVGSNIFLRKLPLVGLKTPEPIAISLKLHPNPVKNSVTIIVSPLTPGKYTIDLYNSKGKIIANIYNGYLANAQYNFHHKLNYPPEIYYVCVMSNKSRTTQKLIIE